LIIPTPFILLNLASTVGVLTFISHECWDEDIWLDNCPPEEYDYEANGEEQPEDIDVDNEFYEDTDITIREKMVQMATDAFKPGWENE